MAQHLCIDQNCKLPLYGRVAYCPLCGRNQQLATIQTMDSQNEPPPTMELAPKVDRYEPVSAIQLPPARISVDLQATVTPTMSASNSDQPASSQFPPQYERNTAEGGGRGQIQQPSRRVGPPAILAGAAVVIVLVGIVLFKNDQPISSASQAIEARQAPAKPPPVATQAKVQLDLTSAESAVRGMLSAHTAKNDVDFDRHKNTLDTLGKPPHQNREAARGFNTEGLRLLREGEVSLAVRQLKLGTEADPADVELRANLGFAQLKERNSAGAIKTLFGALAFSSQRVSSWTALGQSLAAFSDEENAVAAFQIGYRYSGNKENVVQQLRAMRDEQSDPKIISALDRFLKDYGGETVDFPKSTAQKPVSSLSIPVRPTTVAPKIPEQPTAQPSATVSNAKPFSNSVVTDMLDDADACIASKKFDCAITNARSALRIEPGNTRAQSVRQRAEAEQQRALQSISIN